MSTYRDNIASCVLSALAYDGLVVTDLRHTFANQLGVKFPSFGNIIQDVENTTRYFTETTPFTTGITRIS